ncbi:hypothetical protein LOTGIDRAFT_228560 [Lottia gigantea]|uniref:Sushi, von Willebrand factor type A, EGF and pentraxin domain-containing protein 1 n=1 Tax=Lottia gigantea TaxID=225164 RepID=V4AF52_LOTGI|nr:hypothetical protein LOTGIDRAFT_228560 [Lottia gigantea]ESO93785.1 hypothetical protein LOTGIDRAFT_228560 [Lottia gigantea]
MKRITEWFWMLVFYRITLLCLTETGARQTALDITMSMTRRYNTSVGCESINLGLMNCRFYIEQTSSEILSNGKTTILPELTRCINTDSKRCLICLQSQWFVNSCSNLYSLPTLKCPELPKRIFLNPGSSTANIVWKKSTVDGDSRLTTYNNSIKSGQNVTSGFYSLLYSAANTQGLTSVCTTEFLVSDLSPPKISCFPPSNHIIPVDPVSLTAVATWDFPEAVDQSGTIIKPNSIHQVSSNYYSGDVIPRGLHYFQYDVIDVNGASDSCSFTIDMRFVQCRALKPPVNGNITCNSTDFRQNTHCVYSCRPGYILHDFPLLTCLDTEIYDYPEPSCQVLQCPKPSQLSSDSYVSCSNSNNINSTCVVLCKPGYNLTSSTNTASCLPSGNWNTSFPSCTDSEPPVFLSCPQKNIFNHYNSRFENSIPAIWSVIIATDNSGEEITPGLTEGKDSGELFYPGVTKIQYRAVDSKGNEAFCQFYIIMSVLASGCSAGTRFNENADTCVKCAVGFYQDAENALECKPCPGGFTTNSLGCSKIQDCKYNERLLSREKRASTSCVEPVFNDPSILLKCTGYDMNDVCQLSCLSGRQPVGSNRIVCVFDLKIGRFVWLSGSGEQPRCRPRGDLIGMLCTICKQFTPGANCCPVYDLKHTDWMPMDFSEIKPQPPCEDFVPSSTGKSPVSIISGVKSFTLTCPVDMSLPRNTITAKCDLKTGVWDPAPWLQECTNKYSPIKYRLEVTASYSGRSCSLPSVREQLRSKFTSLLHSAKVWKYHCPSSRQCSADDVMLLCSYYRRKRRDIRKRASTMYKTDIKWHFSIRMQEDEMKGEKVRLLKNVLFNMFFGFAEDTYSGKFNQIVGFYFDYASLNMGEFTYVCDTGGIYDITTKACLVCSSGSMYDVNTDRCIECTQGYYQDRDNSRTCFQCPPRTTTQYTGSKYHTQCQIQCSAGYFSANGFLPCLPCPSRGTSSRGSTKCQHKRPLPRIQDFCANSSCVANNHTCQSVFDGYRCFCKHGYLGEECNITINPCTYLQCENGGACEASPGGKAVCKCHDGYTGALCQTKIEWIFIVNNDDLTSTWTEWVSWGDCRTDSPGCGQGTQTRARICIKDVKGTYCHGADTDSRECNKIGCPVEPEWSDWSAWSSCTSMCDGERQRTRKCSSPPFYLGPPLCKGGNLQSYPCSRDYPDRKCLKCSVTDLLIPSPMNVSCSEIEGILTCIMGCQSNQVLYNKLTLNPAYTCNQGIWSPSTNVLPCTDFHQPLALSKMITASYRTNCTDTSKSSNLTAAISRNFDSIFNQVLVQSPQCTSDGLVVTVRIKTNIDKSVTFTKASERLPVFSKYHRVFSINSSEELILPVNVAEISQLHCPDNTVAQGAYCVECPAGSYYHLDECLLCPLGSYQPISGQCSCIRCPFRTTTHYLGSRSLLECR